MTNAHGIAGSRQYSLDFWVVPLSIYCEPIYGIHTVTNGAEERQRRDVDSFAH